MGIVHVIMVQLQILLMIHAMENLVEPAHKRSNTNNGLE